jgi:3'-5' exoribonuclease
MMERVFINQFKKGQAIEGFFLTKDKILSKTKAGNPYLSLRLIDRTGEIEGRVWEKAAELGSLFERDDFVKVQGEIDEFQGILQLRILRLRKAAAGEINLEDFLPKTPQDIDTLFSELRGIMANVRSPHLRGLLDSFFADEAFIQKFKAAPAAKAMHHVYIGGLLEHTLSVVRLILLVGPQYKGIDQELLLAGGFLHDIGKVDELLYARTFDYTDMGRLLGHITLTVEMIEQKIRSLPEFPEFSALLLKHLIISHHGEYVFGSPKRPKTLEALLLHHLDDLDAKMNGFMTWIEKEKDSSSRWTSYHKLFDRFILKPEDGERNENP